MQIKWILLPLKINICPKVMHSLPNFSVLRNSVLRNPVLRNSVLRNSVHINPGAGSKYICKFKEIQFQNLEKNTVPRTNYFL